MQLMILDTEDDQDLVAEFRKRYLSSFDGSASAYLDQFDAESISTLLDNLLKFYHSIPCNSPIRTSIVKTLFSRLPMKFILSLTGLSFVVLYLLDAINDITCMELLN